MSQQLEEVVVTATKRAESMQDVSISMIAMSGDSIKDMGITRGEDFAVDIPAVAITQSPIGNFVFIRGVGTPGVNQGIEQSVSIFHDGIYMGRSQLARAPFMDLERVEVLRGPQSVLFGKNTIGGAIHVISAKPTQEVEGMISGLYGWEDGEKEITGVISGPITDTLSGRLAYRGYELDGYLENVLTGDDGPERDDETLRVQLAWDATDTLLITGKWEQSDFENRQVSTQLANFDTAPAGIGFNNLNQALVSSITGGDGTEKYDDERAVINDGGAALGQLLPQYAGLPGFPDLPEVSENSMELGTLTLDWLIGEHSLTAITGYAHYDYRDICDCDFSALPFIQVDAREDYDQFSQEIRLTSPGGEKLDYIVGLYYHQSDLEYSASDSFGSSLAAPLLGAPAALTPNLSRDYSLDQEQDMWAVFGSATYSFTDTTRLTVGMRYFEESKEVDHPLSKRFTDGWDYSAAVGAPAGTITYGDTAAEYDRFLSDFAGTPLVTIPEGIYAALLGTFEHDIRKRKRDEDDITGSLTLEHDIGGDSMVFATVANGTKGGGFDARFLKTTNDPRFEYDEEKAISYELGVKSSLLDGLMTLNATVFYTEIEDFQVSVFDGQTGFVVQNAAELESKGVEIDIKWAATENLTLGFAGSYLDAVYADYATAPCWTLTGSQPENRGNCIDRGMETERRDASGDTINYAPEFAYNLNFDYRLPVGDALEARAVLNINYSDGYATAGDLDEIYTWQDDYTKVDLRLSLGGVNGMWDVALIGKNLTDEYISGNSDDQPLVPGNGFASTDRLRSYAVQATYRF
ncbi:TonB-dependent receptor [Seongchinamella unica]|uniref:TonB-dependent receptor n=2 Tax=Seongchinamella unica TaxID=2547392 RepID=A0A4R5LR88_9GAMM|nr:TonB-dependent receptor [Seongchinamella unica]